MANDLKIRTSGDAPKSATDKRLEEALDQIRTVPGAAEKFAADPEGYLKTSGIDTSALKFTTGETALSEADLEQVAGGSQLEQMQPGVCASAGGGVCVTVGS